MHYRIDNYIIESELAAKSPSQTNKHMIDIINNIPNNYKVLDYGCGKLRYSIPLAKQVASVVAIDSAYQINKPQKINSFYGCPSEYKLNGLSVCDINNSFWQNKSYDAVLCINVMSAIPYDEMRFKIIKDAYDVLNSQGFLLIVVQYRNSYFNTYKKRTDTIPYYDGWLIKKTNNKCSFYGMPTSEYIVTLCYKAGFTSVNINKKDGSYYVKAFKN